MLSTLDFHSSAWRLVGKVRLFTITKTLQVMVPFIYKEFIDDLTFQVKNDIIPMSRIDDAVKRILRVKFQMGLFENPLADTSLVYELGSKVFYLVVVYTALFFN